MFASKTHEVEVSGYEVFPNLKSDSKKGLHFKLVMIDLDFEKAANYCVEVGDVHFMNYLSLIF